jgi:lipoprotein NlpI
LERRKEVLTALDHAVAVYPGFPLVCRMKGVALLELDDPESALAAFDHAIALDPT